MANILNDQCKKEADHVYKRILTGQQFGKEFPSLIPWLVRNQYNTFELLLTVGPDAKVDESVAQQATV